VPEHHQSRSFPRVKGTTLVDFEGDTLRCAADPRPYVWVKTFEQILASIARHCERISAVGGAQK
jgi:hypothetical protein